MNSTESGLQRIFELVFLPAVLLHELTHAVVYRAFGVDYRMRLTFTDANVRRSHLLALDVPSTPAIVLTCLAPVSLVLALLPVTAALKFTYGIGSALGLVLTAVLAVQAFGLALQAAPSKGDVTAVFVTLGSVNGRAWQLAVGARTVLQFSIVLLWLAHASEYVSGNGLTVPSAGEIALIGGLAACASAAVLIDEEPHHAEADLLTQYACTCWQQGNDEEAERGFQRAIDVVTEHGIGYAVPDATYAGFLAEQWRLDAADRSCRRALEIDPDCALAHVNYAAVLVRQERYDVAEHHCERALELAANATVDGVHYAVTVHINYAEVHCQQERYDAAERHCRLALEIDPEHPMAHSNYADVHAERGRYDEAERRYEQALELGPESAPIRACYADFLASRGDDAAAERQFRRAVELDPDCTLATEEYATFLDERGRTDGAPGC